MSPKNPLHLPYKEPDPKLFFSILKKINHKKNRLRLLKLTLGSTLTSTSLISVIILSKTFFEEFLNSPLYQYSLIFASDKNLLITYSKDILITILESLPTLEITLLLSLLLIFLQSSKLTLNSIKIK